MSDWKIYCTLMIDSINLFISKSFDIFVSDTAS